jgi:hypothetical protein
MKPEYHEVMGVRIMGKRHGKTITRYFLRYNPRIMSKGMFRVGLSPRKVRSMGWHHTCDAYPSA